MKTVSVENISHYQFTNVAPIDFSLRAERERFQSALDACEVEIQQGKYEAHPIINGQKLRGSNTFESLDPSEDRLTIGKGSFATSAQAKEAISVASSAISSWSHTPARKRCEALMNAASIMEEQRLSLAALIVREAGKPWKEADADVAEAIDFLRYYASEMMRLGRARLTQQVLGEQNVLMYKPRGVAVVISPWNFPLAIPCGMVSAALVTGNPVIFKPAEQTSLIAQKLVEILYKAGIPFHALSFLPGNGEEIGPVLVSDPLVQMIVFTGSKQVGLEIIRSAANSPSTLGVKKVVAEMGGKNAIIVDSDADFDEAIKGVLYSAFGYAGQKCSACSRLIVVEPAYDSFIARLAEAAAEYPMGKAKDAPTLVGPLVDEEAKQRVLKVLQTASQDLKIAFKSETPAQGSFVPLSIFRDVPTEHFLWTEEQFAPVLACTSAKSFEEALSIANNSQYALTGGIYSRSPKHIELAIERFDVGNLYINRGTTGAIVQRQPFGGFKLSGVGSKAGGPDYLLQFLEPKTVSENTMRRGFSPDLVS